MSYSNRVFVYAPVSLLLIVAVLYCVYWRVQADSFAARLDRANGGEIVPGLVFAFAEKSVGGFPFRLDAVLAGVTFAHHGPEGETAWRTEKLAIHALSYNHDHYVFEAAGLQSLARPAATPGGPPRVLYATPAIARASAILQHGRLTRFDLDLWQVEGRDASLNADPKRSFSAARAQFHLLGRADKTVDAALKIEGARIGDGFRSLFGPSLPLLEARGRLTHGQALDALRDGGASFAQAAQSWRAMGGVLEVSDLTLNWGVARAILKGTLALDAEDRLMGTLQGDGTQTPGGAAVKATLSLGDEARLDVSGLAGSGLVGSP
jgi:hypothetical protein